MKKNIIYVLIDSLNYKHVKESPIELMPFFNSLKKRAFYCENMYSEAPYTEAALMSSICGQDVLDYGGYMFRFKQTPLTLFEAMHNNGYYVYTTSYEPQCHPSSVKRGIDEYQYMFGFDPAALWSYRFSHFASLYKRNELTEEDYETVSEILKDNLDAWIEWLEDLINGCKTTEMIGDNSKNFDAASALKAVEREQKHFLNDRIEYIHTLLQKGKAHSLFKIGGFPQNNKAKNRANMAYNSKSLKLLRKRIRKMDYELNKKNCKGYKKGPRNRFKELLKSPSLLNLKNYVKALQGSINVLYDLDLNKRVTKNYDAFKDGPSFRTHIDTFIKWAKGYDNKKPFFALLHVNDVHNPEEFFTYDSDDRELIASEIKDANELLDEIPGDYYGSLTHDLSLRYIDGVIKYLYDQLKENNLSDDTIVAICADHGFSFSGNPVRDSYVVNLYLENYNIPFLVTGTEYCGVKIDEMCQSKDIPPTICDLSKGEIPSVFSGRSVLARRSYDNLIIEYCGGGCPDILRREIKLASYDSKWFVGTLGKIKDDTCITEVYDLENDPLQYNNLAKTKNWKSEECVKALLSRIELRKKHIVESWKAL